MYLFGTGPGPQRCQARNGGLKSTFQLGALGRHPAGKLRSIEAFFTVHTRDAVKEIHITKSRCVERGCCRCAVGTLRKPLLHCAHGWIDPWPSGRVHLGGPHRLCVGQPQSGWTDQAGEVPGDLLADRAAGRALGRDDQQPGRDAGNADVHFDLDG
eukprot:3826837-Prymnesium_polylepis.1